MKLEEMTPEAIDYIFANIETDGLTAWQKNFIESTSDQWERKRWLSDKQKEILGQIHDSQP